MPPCSAQARTGSLSQRARPAQPGLDGWGPGRDGQPQLAGDGRVPAGGGVRDAEDQGQVQRTDAGGAVLEETWSQRMGPLPMPCSCRLQRRCTC